MVKQRPRKQSAAHKEARFVAEYLTDLNGTQAAIRAGYARRSAHVTSSKLLRKPHVAVAIAEAMQERAVRTNVTQDRALRELEPLAFSSIADYLFDEEGRLTLAPGAPPNAMAAVAHFKSRVTTDGQPIEDDVEVLDVAPRERTLR